jgi:hypothetical protein
MPNSACISTTRSQSAIIKTAVDNPSSSKTTKIPHQLVSAKNNHTRDWAPLPTTEGNNLRWVSDSSQISRALRPIVGLNDNGPHTPPPNKSSLYHIVDTRSDTALIGKATLDFEIPDIKAGPELVDSKGVTFKGSLDFYLNKSMHGNMFTGVLNIRTGIIDIYPVSIERNDMIDTSWGQKDYQNEFHDHGASIRHPGQSSGELVSHLQLIKKLGENKKPEDYIGFTMLDVRGLRKESSNIKNDDVSMLYGASRSLNTHHVNIVKDEARAKEYPTNAESFRKNPGTFTYHLPMEVKRQVLESISRIIGGNTSWRLNIDNELLRDEYQVSSYASRKEATAQPAEFRF